MKASGEAQQKLTDAEGRAEVLDKKADETEDVNRDTHDQ